VTDLEDSTLTWSHVLDAKPDPGVDVGRVTWDGRMLHERGYADVDGRPTVFVEQWLRTTPDGVSWSAEHGPDWARITVGDWAIELQDSRPSGPFQATRYRRSADRWIEDGGIVR